MVQAPGVRRGLNAAARAAVVTTALVSATAVLGASRPRQLASPADFVRQLAVADPRDTLPTVLAVLAWLLGCWLVGGAVLSLVAQAPGRLGRAGARLAAKVAPRAVRGLVDVAVGVSVAVGTVGGVPAYGAPPPVASAPAVPSLDRPGAAFELPSLDRPLQIPSHAPRPRPAATPIRARPADRGPGAGSVQPRAPHPAPQRVVVVPGDSLWRIAARYLRAGATDAEIGRSWPHWYAANRDVIGPDPDVIRPGQRLAVPSD